MKIKFLYKGSRNTLFFWLMEILELSREKQFKQNIELLLVESLVFKNNIKNITANQGPFHKTFSP